MNEHISDFDELCEREIAKRPKKDAQEIREACIDWIRNDAAPYEAVHGKNTSNEVILKGLLNGKA